MFTAPRVLLCYTVRIFKNSCTVNFLSLAHCAKSTCLQEDLSHKHYFQISSNTTAFVYRTSGRATLVTMLTSGPHNHLKDFSSLWRKTIKVRHLVFIVCLTRGPDNLFDVRFLEELLAP